jgi:hypothetical protein
VVGGGVGCAIAYPVLKKFHDDGAEVHAVIGFKNKDLVILEDKFRAASSVLKVCTDDGSYGRKGLVTDALKELIEAGNRYDEIFAIGPMIMMKFVTKTTQPYGIPTTVSMSPIMIDGTGMCGGCRLSVGGETKFACVDGPDFDGFKVDWDLAVKRNQMYKRLRACTSTRRPAICSSKEANNMANHESLKKNPMPSQAPDIRNKNFEEVTLGYTKEMARRRGGALPALQEPPLHAGMPRDDPDPRFH